MDAYTVPIWTHTEVFVCESVCMVVNTGSAEGSKHTLVRSPCYLFCACVATAYTCVQMDALCVYVLFMFVWCESH